MKEMHEDGSLRELLIREDIVKDTEVAADVEVKR